MIAFKLKSMGVKTKESVYAIKTFFDPLLAGVSCPQMRSLRPAGWWLTHGGAVSTLWYFDIFQRLGSDKYLIGSKCPHCGASWGSLTSENRMIRLMRTRVQYHSFASRGSSESGLTAPQEGVKFLFMDK